MTQSGHERGLSRSGFEPLRCPMSKAARATMKRRKRANETKRRRRKPASIKQQRIAAYRRRSGPRFQANKELRRTDFAARRLAISGVLRTIASSPHDLQPILQAIIDSAVHLCRADAGSFRRVEEVGPRLVASKLSPALSKLVSLPKVRGQGFASSKANRPSISPT